MIVKTETLLLYFSLTFGTTNLPRIEFADNDHPYDYTDRSLPGGLHHQMGERIKILQTLIDQVPQDRHAIEKEIGAKKLKIGKDMYVTDVRLDEDKIIFSSCRLPMPESLMSKLLETFSKAQFLVGIYLRYLIKYRHFFTSGLILFGAYNVPYLNKVAPYLFQARFIGEFFLPEEITANVGKNYVKIASLLTRLGVCSMPSCSDVNGVETPLTEDVECVFHKKQTLFLSLPGVAIVSCASNFFSINTAPFMFACGGAFLAMRDCNKYVFTYFYFLCLHVRDELSNSRLQ